jgi:hypothetical protein
MRAPGLARLLVASAILAFCGCSLIVDTSDIDRGCASSEKLCEGKCVPVSDPAYGCTADLCEPCTFTNAIPRCEAGECIVLACLEGFGCSDCSKNLLIDRQNCGGCGQACASDQHCVNGACAR